jgi:hypothetical protein
MMILNWKMVDTLLAMTQKLNKEMGKWKNGRVLEFSFQLYPWRSL